MNNYTILFLFIIITVNTFAVNKGDIKRIKVPPTICYASDSVARTSVPPPPEFTNRLKSGKSASSTIIVNYSQFPPEARQAFEYAIGIWETLIESPIPIYIQANWRTMDNNVLGSSGPDSYYKNFENANHSDCFYPVAIAEKLTQKEITGPETPDITATFNKSVNWDFGTGLTTPDSLYNFVTVVLHELAHGLGFTGFFFVTNDDLGAYGYEKEGDAATFDFLVQKNQDYLLDTAIFPNYSSQLYNAFTTNSLYASSPAARADGDGQNPRLYAPLNWNEGSSVYHLNEFSYPSGNINSLMTYAIGKAEVIHDPGPLTAGIMADIGWKNLYIDFTKLKDVENIQNLTFNVNLESDFLIDTSSLYLYYSTDTLQTNVDSIPLLPRPEQTLFSASLFPLDTGTIYYYISAGDVKGRTFTRPAEAPQNYYDIHIGPDSQKPEIIHDPIKYYLVTNHDLQVFAKVDDNIAVDTVFVEYKINGIIQPPFGMTTDSADVYSGTFNLDKNQLNDGDSLSYRIIAVDGSSSHNISTYPAEGFSAFPIERISELVVKYANNFDDQTNDFILTDFKIYTPQFFSNGMLNSPHPYPSPDDNSKEYNFSTILKHPVVLEKDGTMTYDEVVLVEPGDGSSVYGDFNFWDYAIVEGSKDSGQTWLPLINGYDSRANNEWLSTYNELITSTTHESKTKGNPDLYVQREINMTENGNFIAKDTILIRFRLYSDPYAHGWGWAIDNLRIQVPVSTTVNELPSKNIVVYPNPFHDKLYFTFDLEAPADKVKVEIFSIYGQLVKKLQFNNLVGRSTKSVEISDLSEGMYLLKISENEQLILSKKLIKSSN